jgi:DNA-binding Xre family transcriptional regulator
MMARKLDYRWNLRQLMASGGMFQTTDLIGPLEDRGIRLSSSQVYRLVVDRPERLSLKVLMALLDVLDCSMEELIEPVAAAAPPRRSKAAGGTDTGVGDLRPKRARITRVDE